MIAITATMGCTSFHRQVTIGYRKQKKKENILIVMPIWGLKPNIGHVAVKTDLGVGSETRGTITSAMATLSGISNDR